MRPHEVEVGSVNQLEKEDQVKFLGVVLVCFAVLAIQIVFSFV